MSPRKWAVFAGLAVLIVAVGCASASPTPTQTPLVIYVTPAPTPIAEPTPVPNPTMTPDDLLIEAVIRDGYLAKHAQINEWSDNSPEAEAIANFTRLRDFAWMEQLRIDTYRPSVCTADAVRLYREAMSLIEFWATDILSWGEGGSVGPPPSPYDAFTALEAAPNALRWIASQGLSCG